MSNDFSESNDFSDGPDSVTEVTTTGWLQRLFGSVLGLLVGVVLLILSVILLWANEGRAVSALRALQSGARQLVEANPAAIDPALDGKLVHLSGRMDTAAPARDPVFEVSAPGVLRLKRVVEMYQWTESKSTQTHKNLGGSETKETTYTYTRQWSQEAVDSSRFHEANGHRNPSMPVHSQTTDSTGVTLGPYRIEPALLDRVGGFEPFALPNTTAAPPDYRKDANGFYRGQDSGAPAIGDVRVSYQAVPVQTMSVVAAQTSGGLAPFREAGGYTIALVDRGAVPAAEMFHEKQGEERLVTWALRLAGFVVMLIGLCLIAHPLGVLVGVIPVLETIVGIGTFLMALTIALPLTFTVIALAWVAHRPLIGVGLIAAGIVLGYLARQLYRPSPRVPVPAGR